MNRTSVVNALEMCCAELDLILKEQGGCEHSAGICACSTIRAVDAAKAALSAPEASGASVDETVERVMHVARKWVDVAADRAQARDHHEEYVGRFGAAHDALEYTVRTIAARAERADDTRPWCHACGGREFKSVCLGGGGPDSDPPDYDGACVSCNALGPEPTATAAILRSYRIVEESQSALARVTGELAEARRVDMASLLERLEAIEEDSRLLAAKMGEQHEHWPIVQGVATVAAHALAGLGGIDAVTSMQRESELLADRNRLSNLYLEAEVRIRDADAAARAWEQEFSKALGLPTTHAFSALLPLVREQRTAAARMREALGTPALVDVAAERVRQQSVEGWTAAHDDEAHSWGALASAAACYALVASSPEEYESDQHQPPRDHNNRSLWPWDFSWWKSKNRRSDLVRAGALILAEIERLDRAARAAPRREPAP